MARKLTALAVVAAILGTGCSGDVDCSVVRPDDCNALQNAVQVGLRHAFPAGHHALHVESPSVPATECEFKLPWDCGNGASCRVTSTGAVSSTVSLGNSECSSSHLIDSIEGSSSLRLVFWQHSMGESVSIRWQDSDSVARSALFSLRPHNTGTECACSGYALALDISGGSS